MRTKWEEGVRRNLARLDMTRANLATWEAMDGWVTNPEYMRKLTLEVRKQTQYLKNRYGEVL